MDNKFQFCILFISASVLLGCVVFYDSLTSKFELLDFSDFYGKYLADKISFANALLASYVYPYIEKIGFDISSLTTLGKFDSTQSSEYSKPEESFDVVFSKDELRKYDGKNEDKGPYIALLGLVFDVSKGRKIYGPGGSYEFFTGRDASRAFVTGDFTEAGLIDDITGLTSQDYLGLDDWIKFYQSDYKYIGKVAGRFYDKNGIETPYRKEVQGWIEESLRLKDEESKRKEIFPHCNSEWNPENGARVYCTTRSGGTERDWVGVPRRLFEPGGEGVKMRERCACVRDSGPPSHDPNRSPHSNRGDLDHPSLKSYPGCPPLSSSCQVPEK